MKSFGELQFVGRAFLLLSPNPIKNRNSDAPGSYHPRQFYLNQLRSQLQRFQTVQELTTFRARDSLNFLQCSRLSSQ
jgi:hypothetical protein